MAKFIAMLFTPLWVALSLPISLSIVFTILRPIIMKDTTGVSMIIVAAIVVFLDIYIGVKIFEKKIQPWLEKRKIKSHYP